MFALLVNHYEGSDSLEFQEIDTCISKEEYSFCNARRISEEIVRNWYEDLYGSNSGYVEPSTKMIYDKFIPSVYYDSLEKMYYLSFGGGYTAGPYRIDAFIHQIETEGRNVYVYESIVYMNGDDSCLYKDRNYTEKVECFQKEEFSNMMHDDGSYLNKENASNFEQYRYTFTLDENDCYIFQQVELFK